MNQRIDQIAKQCWSHRIDGTLIDGHLHFDHHKFANLIVLDMIDNVRAWEKDSRNHISYMLKQYYGIDE
jgi:hypothetical protein